MDEKFTVEFYETEKDERPSLDFINTGLSQKYGAALNIFKDKQIPL